MKTKITALLLVCGVGTCFWYAAQDGQPRVAKKQTQKLLGPEGEEVEIGEGQPDKPIFESRVYPVGEIDVNALQRARQQVNQMRLQQGQARGLQLVPIWIQRGPNNVQGRITGIAVDPTNDNIAYAGAADGGIFKTVDSGNTWVPVFDQAPTLSIGAVTIDPSNPNVIYVGTGEANFEPDSYPGDGLYRSIDGGVTWENIGLEFAGRIGRIVVSSTDPDVIHAAVSGYTWSKGPDRGVYRTDDGGDNWTKVLYVDNETGCIDIIQRPDNPNVLLAAMWQRYRSPGFRIVGGTSCGVYRSDDGGLNWTPVGGGLPASSADNGRIGLALCHSDPDVMCAGLLYLRFRFWWALLIDRWGFQLDTDQRWCAGQRRSEFLVVLWQRRIHPWNPDIIYIPGFFLGYSDDGGATYGEVGNNMHVDHHAFAFGMGSTPKYYAGNDGGVYTSNDGINFDKTTGDLPITQAYRVATASWDLDALWCGTQDNGTQQDANGDGVFGRIFGGDGFEVIPHLNDPDRMWVQYQWGNVRYTDDGGDNWSNATSGLGNRRNWNSPHVQDPSDPETRYFGSQYVHRNDGNTAWTDISPDLTDGDQSGTTAFGTLTTIGVSPVDGDVIWAGADDGNLHVTVDGGANWTDVSAGLPTRWITSVRPHPNAAHIALVSVSGFQWGEDMAHIYRTINYGQNWTAVDGNLPDIPVNDVWWDENYTKRYFAATDLGVFQTKNQGLTWSLFGVGLPAVAVDDFAYRSDTRELVAGTHGRSLLTITIPEVFPDIWNVARGTGRLVIRNRFGLPMMSTCRYAAPPIPSTQSPDWN